MVAASGGDNDRTIHIRNTAQKEQEGRKQIPILFSSIYQEIHLYPSTHAMVQGSGWDGCPPAPSPVSVCGANVRMFLLKYKLTNHDIILSSEIPSCNFIYTFDYITSIPSNIFRVCPSIAVDCQEYNKMIGMKILVFTYLIRD